MCFWGELCENRNGRVFVLFLAQTCKAMPDSTNKLEGIISMGFEKRGEAYIFNAKGGRVFLHKV